MSHPPSRPDRLGGALTDALTGALGGAPDGATGLTPGRAGAPGGAVPAPPPPADTIDVADAARAVARGWRALAAGALAGALLALLVVWLVPPRYAATTTVLLRSASDPTSSILSRVGLPADIAGSVGGGALGNVLKSPMETELQLLKSRDVLGEVVDSLGLQARVLAPRGVPAARLLEPARYPGAFRRVTLAFERRPDGTYDVTGAGAPARVAAGGAVALPVVGRVRLAAGPLPETFRVRIEDHEDAIDRLDDRLDVEKQGGELAAVRYAGYDSLSAARVPNAIAAAYFQRRRTVDRGLNQRRYEFLVAQADSVRRELGPAEDALRAEQERTGVFEPELAGRSGQEAVLELRKELLPLEAELQSARQLLARYDAGAVSARELAAFPAFLRSPAINTILLQLTTIETERTRLLERRTPRDPEVVVLAQSVAQLEAQLGPLARTYTTALDRQTAELRQEAAELEGRLRALPRDAEGNLRRQRDVRRLAQTLLGVQAQIIDVRLAAVGEGGQVRVVDAAVPPKKIRFPRPLPTVAVLTLLGLLGGAVWAAAGGARGARVLSAADAERLAYAPGFDGPSGPALAGAVAARVAREATVVVAAAGPARDHAAALAARVTRALLERGQDVAHVSAAAGGGARQVAAAEGAHAAVVVAAGEVADPATAELLDAGRAALLVVRAGRTARAELAAAAGALLRAGVPCVGVLVADGPAGPADVPPAAANGQGTPPARRPEPGLAAAGADPA